MYLYIPAMYFCCCLLLLLLCSVLLYWCCCCCHRAPDGQICCCGSLHLIPVFSFFSFKHDIFSMYPLAVLSHLQQRFFTYSTYHTSSVIAGMRGAKAGVSPPRRRPPCILLCLNVFFRHFGIFFSSGRGSFQALSAPWHAGSPTGHHGASLGPGRCLWHVLWGFKVVSPHGE